IGPQWIADGAYLVWTRVSRDPQTQSGIYLAAKDGSNLRALALVPSDTKMVAPSSVGVLTSFSAPPDMAAPPPDMTAVDLAGPHDMVVGPDMSHPDMAFGGGTCEMAPSQTNPLVLLVFFLLLPGAILALARRRD